jgi:hypothetical protein
MAGTQSRLTETVKPMRGHRACPGVASREKKLGKNARFPWLQATVKKVKVSLKHPSNLTQDSEKYVFGC